MIALGQHLRRHDEPRGGGLAFRRDCPICRAERVAGTLPDDRVLSMGARATIAIGSLLAGSAMPAAVATAHRGDGTGEGVAIQAPPTPEPPADSAPPRGSLGAGTVAATGDGRSDRPQTGRGPERGDKNEVGEDVRPPTTPAPGGGERSEGQGATPDAEPVSEPQPALPDASPLPGSAATTASPTPGGKTEHPSVSAVPAATTPLPAAEPAASAHARQPHPGAYTTAGVTPAEQSTNAGAQEASRNAATGGPRTEERDATRSRDIAAERSTYVVREGDCLWRVAAGNLAEGASDEAIAREVTRLWKLNAKRIGTGNPDLIYPGQTLEL